MLLRCPCCSALLLPLKAMFRGSAGRAECHACKSNLVISRPSWVTGLIIVGGTATYRAIRSYESFAIAFAIALIVGVTVDICLSKLTVNS